FGLAREVGAEQRLDDDRERQLGHLDVDRDHAAVFERIGHLPGVRRHDVAVAREPAVMEGGLDQPALLLPELPVARQQPFPGKGQKGLLDETRLDELLRLLDQNLPRQVGVGQLIYVYRTSLVIRDIAVLPRDVQAERERIERKDRRQQLPDD